MTPVSYAPLGETQARVVAATRAVDADIPIRDSTKTDNTAITVNHTGVDTPLGTTGRAPSLGDMQRAIKDGPAGSVAQAADTGIPVVSKVIGVPRTTKHVQSLDIAYGDISEMNSMSEDVPDPSGYASDGSDQSWTS